jgi:MFS transporter, DHA2 family, multidrug resistance protein
MNKWIVALTVIIPTLIEVVDTAVVNVSLDHIRGSLSAGVDEATWTITSYLVSNAIIIPLTGWLARFFGRKRYLMFSIALFTISSFFCGCAWNLSSLIFFRVMQGIGGGALQPISQAILLETFPVVEHGMAMAIFGIGVMFAPIIGPLLGGWITDNWSWHWIFYINIPIGIISLFMVALVIKDPAYLQRVRSRIDYWGLGLITVGLGFMQIILDKGQQEDWFNSAFIVRMAVISFVALVAFVIIELQTKDPVVDLRVFKNIGFATGNFIMFFSFFVLFGTIVLLPIFLQRFLGYTAFLAGWALAPGGVATLFAMPTAGLLVKKVNPKGILIFGLLVTAYSTWVLTRITESSSLEFIIWARILMGLGLGFAFIVLTNLTLSSIPKESMGNATGVYNLIRNLGGSFGVAFVTTTLAQRSQFHQFRFSEGLHPLELTYQIGLQKVTSLVGTGAAPQLPQSVIYQELLRQSGVFAFRDVFFLSTMILLTIIPFVFFMRRVATSGATLAAH